MQGLSWPACVAYTIQWGIHVNKKTTHIMSAVLLLSIKQELPANDILTLELATPSLQADEFFLKSKTRYSYLFSSQFISFPANLVPVYPVYYNELFNKECLGFLNSIELVYPAVFNEINLVSQCEQGASENFIALISFLASSSHHDVLPLLDQLLSAVASPAIRHQIFLALVASVHTGQSLAEVIRTLAQHNPEALDDLCRILSAINNPMTQQSFVSAMIELGASPAELAKSLNYLATNIDNLLLRYLQLLESIENPDPKQLFIIMLQYVLDKKGKLLMQLFAMNEFRHPSFRRHIANLLVMVAGSSGGRREELIQIFKLIAKKADDLVQCLDLNTSTFTFLLFVFYLNGFIEFSQVGPGYENSITYLGELFRRELSGTICHERLAQFLVALLIRRHSSLFFLLGHQLDSSSQLPAASNETLLQLLHEGVNQSLLLPEQAGTLLLGLWTTPALIDFFEAIYTYVTESGVSPQNRMALERYFAWASRYGRGGLNATINRLPYILRFVFFRTLALFAYSHYQTIPAAHTADLAALASYPHAQSLLQHHAELFNYLPAAELASNFALLLTATGYSHSPEESKQKGWQRINMKYAPENFNFSMRKLLSLAFSTGEIEVSAPLPLQTSVLPVAQTDTTVQIITQRDRLLELLQERLAVDASLQPDFNLDQVGLISHLQNTGLLTDVPRSQSEAVGQVKAWLEAGCTVFIFKLTEQGITALEIQQGQQRRLRIQIESGFSMIGEDEFLDNLATLFNLETDILAALQPGQNF